MILLDTVKLKVDQLYVCAWLLFFAISDPMGCTSSCLWAIRVHTGGLRGLDGGQIHNLAISILRGGSEGVVCTRPYLNLNPKKTKRTLKKEIFFRIYSTDAILMSTPEDGKKFAT